MIGRRDLPSKYSPSQAPVPTVAIYSPKDGVVAWKSCVDEPGPERENIAIEHAHTTMLAHPKTLRIIAERLALP